ncbi:histidine--tRNA ligase [Mycoplasmopsis columboralis]|uniref:Histidine--tRNA ligase n=1 Tax=Mycoplasmopsis columboralis TaxID=171282 RepID=A0A449B676_9BACT|nr:histidine--tRNA ligase [Mycoplasmopsis columboralis]VEU76104.1 Histidyl-tRNA synthetase [Mycoplasmopsis columboralis]
MVNKVKGTIDYSIEQYKNKRLVLNNFEFVAEKFGFNFIETPILEYSELFKRSNEQSEMVKKEMFEFLDKGGREIVLRPEGTASFVRSYINNKWYAQNEVDKFAYWGPMFRYERPQAGRYRQFYQAGVEYVGPKSPFKDVHVIMTATTLLEWVSLENSKNIKLHINSIGDATTRENYQKALKEFLLPYKDQLSEISQERLESNNVLRILDDKIDSKLPFMKNAPKIAKFYSVESQKYFKDVLNLLDFYDVDYKINPNLVRGLDYYDEVVFEFVLETKEGQNTIIGGGRYSNLIKQLGGPDVSSVGFGFGVDRLLDLIESEPIPEPSHEVPNIGTVINPDFILAASSKQSTLENLFALYFEFIYDENIYSVNFVPELTKSKKIFEMAKKQQTKYLIYEDELISNPDVVFIKNMENGKKMQLDISDASEAFDQIMDFVDLD